MAFGVVSAGSHNRLYVCIAGYPLLCAGNRKDVNRIVSPERL
jgi:hypothetical protein